MNGNPTAIGARIELVAKGGSRAVRRVISGSGYLSSGTACAFFGGVHTGAELHVTWPDGMSATQSVPDGAHAVEVVR